MKLGSFQYPGRITSIGGLRFRSNYKYHCKWACAILPGKSFRMTVKYGIHELSTIELFLSLATPNSLWSISSYESFGAQCNRPSNMARGGYRRFAIMSAAEKKPDFTFDGTSLSQRLVHDVET